MAERLIPKDMCTVCDFRRLGGGCGEKDYFNSETHESIIEIVAQRARNGICTRAKHIGDFGEMRFIANSMEWKFIRVKRQ